MQAEQHDDGDGELTPIFQDLARWADDEHFRRDPLGAPLPKPATGASDPTAGHNASHMPLYSVAAASGARHAAPAPVVGRHRALRSVRHHRTHDER